MLIKARHNPSATNNIYIRLNSKTESEDVVIIDFLGKIYAVSTEMVNAYELNINVENIPGGLYMIRVKTDESYEYLKFVKQ